MVKLPNGLYKDEGKFHLYFYKVIGSCTYRYSKTLGKWILCLDTEINKQVKMIEDVL